MRLTKTEFVEHQACPKAHWLRLHKPGAVERAGPNAFDQLQMRWGYEVERMVQDYVRAFPDADRFTFQDEFESEDGLYARADLVRNNGDGSINIYEVKSSTSLREENGPDHVDDAAFQTVVAERWGASVRSIFVVHLNSEYVRQGVIDPSEFIVFEEVTEKVRERYSDVAAAADQAVHLLNQTEIDESWCICLHKSRGNHCEAFDYFNRDIEQPSIYLLPNLRKAQKFAESGITSLLDVPEEELSPTQKPVRLSAELQEPVINRPGIRTFLNELEWPLYFYDYETVAAPIPRADGHSPRKQIPVQFSLHRLDEDGSLTHSEYLCMSDGDQEALVLALRADIGPKGSLVAWNMRFERGCNKLLGKMFPEHVHFLHNMSDRTVDLMDPFKANYVDLAFEGSTSIKKVLPVLCPELSYNDDAVHDGGMAVAAWVEMVETINEHKRERLTRELREYCELDSLAMVRIFQYLQAVVR